MKYSPRQIREAAEILYAMTPGTEESSEAYNQMQSWAQREEATSAGHMLFLEIQTDKSIEWESLHEYDQGVYERTAQAVIEYGRKNETN